MDLMALLMRTREEISHPNTNISAAHARRATRLDFIPDPFMALSLLTELWYPTSESELLGFIFRIEYTVCMTAHFNMVRVWTFVLINTKT